MLKCHLVFVHIMEILERKGIGAFSEQWIEEMHHEWCEWENKLTDVNSELGPPPLHSVLLQMLREDQLQAPVRE